MAALLVISIICIHSTLTDAVNLSVLLSHKTAAGSLVAKLPWQTGQKSQILDSRGSELFHIQSGEVITVSDISKVVHETLPLVVKHELGTDQWLDSLHVKIIPSTNSADHGLFSNTEYEGFVKENESPGTVVQGLKDLFKRSVSYKLASGGFGLFKIVRRHQNDSETPVIVTTQLIDRESHSQYTLVIEAHNGTHFDETAVYITIGDDNDNNPSFRSRTYAVTVDYADVIHKSRILSIQAHDADIDTVHYKLSPNDVFDVDDNGDIFAKSPTEVQSRQYLLELVAVDSAGHSSIPASIALTVSSDLKFVTKHSRVRRQAQTDDSATVTEAADILYTFNAAQWSTPRYSITNVSVESVKNLIRISDNSLRLRPGRKLDYEKEEQRSISVVVNITDGGNLVEIRTIQITVTNVNDEPPYFITKPDNFLATVLPTTSEGTLVFTVVAKDDDAELAKVEYFLVSGGNNRFQVNANNGEITVVGSTTFQINHKYYVLVEARDVNSNPVQKTQRTVEILVGEREPQIFKSSYVVDVPENTRIPFIVETVKARRFQDAPLRYTLLDNLGQTPSAFTITSDGPQGGEVRLVQTLDYEDPEQPKEYNLRVVVSEQSPSGLSSSVSLLISVTDMNDHDPNFPISTYVKRQVREDTDINVALLNVTASDADSGRNAELTFSVLHPLFAADTIGNSGIIKVNGRLDYDRTASHVYEFQVVATDHGDSPRSGSATVSVWVTNVNDEDPEFSTNLKAEVFENANKDQFVHTVHVTDPDGDNVEVYFKTDSGESETSGPFQITPQTGRVFLREQLPSGQFHYVLNLTAVDDGSCCTTSSPRRRSEAALIVEIVDVNDNRPEFPDCQNYNTNPPSVKENSEIGSRVFQVSANDLDTGENGRIRYKFISTGIITKFNIDAETGIITVAESIDREAANGARDLGITVEAIDHGVPRLNNVCSFRILVEDVNDNPPIFTQQTYTPSIEEKSKIDTSVIRLVANDLDSGENRRVEYSLIENPDSLFKINNETGILRLATNLGGLSNLRPLMVMAQDHGKPNRLNTTAIVNVRVTQNLVPPPIFIGDVANNIPIYVNETHKVGYQFPITTIRANATGNRDVNFLFINDRQIPVSILGPFAIRRPPGQREVMQIYLRSRLDFEQTESYELKIRAAVESSNSDIIVKIMVIDQNDEQPAFIGYNPQALTINGSLTENRTVGQTVVTLQAQDLDKSANFRNLRFSFYEDRTGDVASNFTIDPDTGLITTRTDFDLESFLPQGIIRFTVKVDDRVQSADEASCKGCPNSATAVVEVLILDVNDNKPKFEKAIWEASVFEDVDIGHPVLTLSASDLDKDSQMFYSIESGGNDFTVERRSGIIRVANLLDFENKNRRFYNLTVQVYDGKYIDKANVEIQVLDANDNAPEFPPGPYDVRNIVEESLAVTKIVTVNATDPDTERPNKIEYSLNGPLADDGTFSIDRTTGEITLHRPLDRDKPDGQVVYEFNVLAVDEPDHPETKRTGVSYVRVFPIDINDNNPKFDQSAISGSVLEHTVAGSLGGSQVFAVNAVDNDFGENARVEYTLVNQPQHNGLNIFGIDRTSGQISVITQDPNVLDRETQAEYTLTVRATDKGPNPTPVDQDIKINLDDKNDQWPVFSQTIYKVTMSENLPKGASVTSVTASDKDIGINAQLIYSLDSNKDIGYFYIDTRNATNEGILRVFESSKIDYEDPSLRFFNVTVNVDDVPNPSHKVTAYIEVTVQDFNDNKPVFTRDTIPKEVYEDIPVGTVLATFSADDIDEGLNAEFVYSIDHGSDPKRQFRVNSSGVVTLNKPLDREQDESHNVIVLAIDKGTPPQTGSATLMLRVLDINDNAPDFLEDYVVYFKENVATVQKWKGVILATDPDTAVNGPPFTFALPCDWNCPCEFFQNCDKFNMSFGRNEQYPDGFATVSTRARLFDREQTKEYYMPIVMWDSGDPVMTATRSLHIVIRDENDNHHEAALKKILVYSYDGFRALQDVEIGRVYAKDPDDWDVVDKEFTVVKEISPHFSVVKTSGMILMSGKPEEGTYKFIVAVFDRTFEEMVNSEVEITVKKIPTAAVYSSGSIRLNGITARDFVERDHKESGKFGEYEQSKYDKMRTELAKKLNVPEANVEIFSVRDGDGVTDVRFAAHGSPWYKSSKLDGLIARNKEEFEQNVGVTVGMVPIDECLYEICDHGCYNKYVVSDVPRVIAGNSTSFVGVDAYLEQACNTCDGPSGSDCTCKAGEFPTECRSDFCYNGGTCYIDDWKEMRCKCEEDFDGARCQQTKHSFKGNGYALYPALAQCEHGLTSLEFITTRSNCLIFYNGPMDTDLGVQDHISLQLRSGSPVLTIDHGTGTLELTLGNKKLADGQWHRIDISSAGKVITLTVDNCDTAVVTENETMSSEDRTSCEKSGTTPGENGFLNVNTLLQMGGTYADPPSQFLTPGLNDFDGCIKNFRHLGLLYDLYMGNTGLQEGTFDGCPQEEKSCGSVNDINGLVCGQNGICVGNLEGGAPTCICKPGWMGKKCETETPTKDFGKESYMVWQLRMATEASRNRVQLKFRSRDKDGVLFSVMSSSRTEYLNLQIRDYMLQAIFHSEKPLILTLDKVNASNGHWHTAYLERRGKRMKLYMDGGEGPYYIDSQGLTRGRRVLEIAPDNVFGGAVVSGNIIQNPTLNDYESSCMTDVRLDGNLFPMDKSTGSNAAVLTLAKNIENGCTRDDCTNNTKCHGQNIVCVPLWEGYDCRCEVGYAPDPQGNCLGLCRCENGGKCEYDNKYELGYYCICQREFTGLHCETAVSLLVEAQLSDESLAAILVCAFLLLVMLLAVFLYLKLRKPKEKMMLDDDPYDDIRENIVNYDEDGAGEEDQNAFDFSRIRVPVDGTLPTKVPFENTPRRVDRPLQSSMQPGEAPPDVGNFIHGRLKDADDDLGAPPHDSVREFADEGGGSDAGSLSSLNTSTSSGDQDYDYLNDWGPKFAKLADMYGAGQGDED